VGKHTDLVEHGVIGYAILNSHNLRQSLERYIKYLPLTGPVMDVKLAFSKGRVHLRAEPIQGLWPINDQTVRYFTQEWMATINSWGELCGLDQGLFTEVNLSFDDHLHQKIYHNNLFCPINFDQPFTEVIFPEHYLDRPFTLSSDILGDLCASQCQRLLKELESHHGWAAEVYQKLSRMPSIPDINTMAEALFMSPRTLRRRLASEQTTYQQLVIDFRMSMAKQYLTETQLPMVEISDLIGYKNPANFYRVFFQLENMTPQRYREAHSDVV